MIYAASYAPTSVLTCGASVEKTKHTAFARSQDVGLVLKNARAWLRPSADDPLRLTSCSRTPDADGSSDPDAHHGRRCKATIPITDR